MTKIKKLSSDGLDNFVKKIIRGDDSSNDLRKMLVEATSRNEKFITFLADNIGFDGVLDANINDDFTFNEQQYRSPAEDEEKKLADININCTACTATSPDYWGSLTLGLIESGAIKSRYLAAQPNDSKNKNLTGGYRIDHALKTGKHDDLSRFILRSFTGHERIRNTGYRDYYQFCPISRAWWRHKLSEESANLNGLERHAVHKALTNKGIWYHLSEKGVSKLTVISDIKIFSGLTHFLVSNNVKSQKECAQITAFLGAQTTWRALGAFDPVEISSSIIAEYWEART